MPSQFEHNFAFFRLFVQLFFVRSFSPGWDPNADKVASELDGWSIEVVVGFAEIVICG